MGGRWDATSAVTTIESVAVTGIGLDHMRILGDTVEAIAGEKAAIIRRGRTCVLGVGCALPETVEDVFLERARAEGVTPTYVRAADPDDVAGIMGAGTARDHAGLPRVTFTVTERPKRLGTPLLFDVETPYATYVDLGCLKTRYQAANITCAIALVEQILGRALDAAALFESVATCPTPGRFDLVRPDPVGLIDACHNPQSVETFLAAFDDVCPEREGRPTLILAVLSDKDVDGICRLAAGAFDRIVCTRTSSRRALAASDLAEALRSQGVEPVAVFEDLEEAVASVDAVPFVAFGSITLAGEVAALFGRGAVA
jgi:dihydrofolate synthase/folylpolyglutamate synthase